MESKWVRKNRREQMEVRYVNWALANKFKNHIELNVNLKKAPALHDAILKHELTHEEGGWDWNDLKLDLQKTENVKSVQLLKFMIRYPKTLLQFFPVYWTKDKGVVYDINLIIIYSVIFSMAGLGLVLGNVFN